MAQECLNGLSLEELKHPHVVFQWLLLFGGNIKPLRHWLDQPQFYEKLTAQMMEYVQSLYQPGYPAIPHIVLPIARRCADQTFKYTNVTVLSPNTTINRLIQCVLLEEKIKRCEGVYVLVKNHLEIIHSQSKISDVIDIIEHEKASISLWNIQNWEDYQKSKSNCLHCVIL